MPAERIIITSRRPLRKGLVAVLALCVLGGVGLAAYLSGGRDIAKDLAALSADFRQVSEHNVRLTRENEGLRTELAFARRTSEINRRSVDDVQRTLVEQRERISELEENVGFYRAILKPEKATRSFSVHSFELEPIDPQGRRFAFRLVLTQVLKSDKVLEGTVDFTVSGETAGRPASKTFRELTASGDPLHFRFRYFQMLEGELTLPPDFQPRRVFVEAVLRGKERSVQVRRNFAWSGEAARRSDGTS